LKVWGVLFLSKMSIYNPTPLPPDICDKCIAVLSERIGQLEIDRVLKKVTETHYKIERIGLDLQVMYYNRRKEMHNKNARLH